MYRTKKAPHGSRGSWARSGRYGNRGKKYERKEARQFASIVGWNIERMLGIR